MLDVKSIERPAPPLLAYYFLVSLLSGPLIIVAFPPLFFRYHTLRYKFDNEGVSASWGFLFKKEVHLTYRRIQDIHLSKNFVQRWMGLATVKLQTASGSATPELSIEGVLEAEALRDALYLKMRGGVEEEDTGMGSGLEVPQPDEALLLLHEIRDLIRGMAQGRSNP
ncbi:MAG: hypothetical protein AMXMBFR84_36330 [Candidatus Hydrogenedentota bacterium]